MATFVPLLASVTLTPALLALPNDRLSGFRSPSTDDESETPPQRRFDLQGLVTRIAEKALARPVLSVAIASIVLLALAAVAPRLNLGLIGVESLPERLDGGRTVLRLNVRTPGLRKTFPPEFSHPSRS